MDRRLDCPIRTAAIHCPADQTTCRVDFQLPLPRGPSSHNCLVRQQMEEVDAKLTPQMMMHHVMREDLQNDIQQVLLPLIQRACCLAAGANGGNQVSTSQWYARLLLKQQPRCYFEDQSTSGRGIPPKRHRPSAEDVVPLRERHPPLAQWYSSLGDPLHCAVALRQQLLAAEVTGVGR